MTVKMTTEGETSRYGVWLYYRALFFKRWEQLQISFPTAAEAHAWITRVHPDEPSEVRVLSFEHPGSRGSE